jgi:hypothetical protein
MNFPDHQREELLLLRFAEEPHVRLFRLDWPQMARFTDAVRRLESRKFESRSERNLELVLLGKTLIFALADGPISPSHPSLEGADLVEKVREASGVSGGENELLEELWASLVELLHSRHPAADFLENFISSRPEIEAGPDYARFGGPAIVLCYRDKGSSSLLAEWVEDERLFVGLERYNSLRKSPPWPCQVVFGPPSRYGASKWVQSPESDYLTQWMFTAPRAEEVVALLWPPHKNPNFENLGPWPSFEARGIHDESLQQEEAFPVIEESVHSPSNPPVFSEETLATEAERFELVGPNGPLWVYFEPSEAPYPRFYAALGKDERQSEVLRSGSHLIFRTSRAEESEIHALAEQWWNAREVSRSYSDSLSYVQNIRAIIRAKVSSLGVSEFAERLTSVGVRKKYSTYVAKRLLMPHYLAPEAWENLAAVAKVCGLELRETDFNLIRQIRASRATAGRQISRNLLSALSDLEHTDVEDELLQTGYATPSIDGGEPLLIARVVSSSSGLHNVPASKLGIPVRRDGSTWLE